MQKMKVDPNLESFLKNVTDYKVFFKKIFFYSFTWVMQPIVWFRSGKLNLVGRLNIFVPTVSSNTLRQKNMKWVR